MFDITVLCATMKRVAFMERATKATRSDMERTQSGLDSNSRRRFWREEQASARVVLSVLSVLALSVGVLFCDDRSYADEVAEEQTISVDKSNTVSGLDILGIKVGVSGVYKSGFQTQVVLTWTPDAAVSHAELETIDSDGTPFVVSRVLSEEEKNAGELKICAVLPKASGTITARLLNNEDPMASRVFAPKADESSDVVFNAPAPAAKPIYLTIGSDDLGFSEAFAELRLKEERRPLVVKIDSLPVDFRAYDAIDKLFISMSTASEILKDFRSDSPEILAIENWVKRGGFLVLLADEKSIPLLGTGKVLSNLSPGATVLERAQEFRSVNALTAELQNVKNLAMTGSKTKPFLRVPVISELKEGAKVEMQEVETPLLVARPIGLGTTIFFAADPSEAPLNSWSGRGRLMLKFLGINPEQSQAKSTNGGFIKRGYVDLSGQVRSALDSFEGVKIVSFAIVAGLIFVYLLCVGPLDWAIAKKGVKKPNVTWLTFPAFAVVFCVVAVMLTNASTPKKPVLNQVDLIDIDMTSGMTRDSSWFGFYSPTGDRYELDFAPGAFTGTENRSYSVDAVSADVDLIPLTLTGGGIGGAEQKSYTTRVWDEPYRAEKSETFAKLVGAPLTTRSSKSFFGRWTGVLRDLPSVPSLSDDGLVLRGSVVNPFDVPIYSAYVLYQGGAYALGTLAPGETKIERGMTRVEPLRVLNEHQSSVPTAKLKNWSSSSYNNSSTRLPYILRTASFYDFGGGENNFGITKCLQSDVDLSNLIRCGRAVIFGTIVDAYAADYESTDDLGRKSADALELERLDRKIAAQRGETVENALESAIEKYGLSGSSDEFAPTRAGWKRSSEDELKPADKRTVVVRLIVPLQRGH